MRTIETTLYQFEELSAESRQKAIETNSTINIDFDWWDCTYEGMREMGVEINSFDIYHRDISITIEDSEYTAKQIVKNYGEGMDVYISSKRFTELSDALVSNELDEKIEYLEEEYRQQMAQSIFTWLYEEYDYLQSEESIAQALVDNEYEFTKDGIRW